MSSNKQLSAQNILMLAQGGAVQLRRLPQASPHVVAVRQLRGPRLRCP